MPQPKPITKNTLFYGDNLPIMRDYIPDQSVDLVYLDPPFNSNRSYNVLFKDEKGKEAEAQLGAFEDSWHWNEATETIYRELLTDAPARLIDLIDALRQGLGTSQMMAYLVMMAARLVQLHRVLKPTGSLYLHCDPTASHYLKMILDSIFGPERFVNEIIWQRTNAKGLAFTRFATNHDVILRYAKSDKWIWHPQYTTHDPQYIEKFYRFRDEDTGRVYSLADLTNPNKDRPNLTYEFLGVTRVWRWTKDRMQKAYEQGLIVQSKPGTVPRLKRYLDEQEGNPIGDVWTDISPIQSQGNEYLGYPTQKPLSLLERIICASTNPGDVVLDPFAGCGTTVAAAQKVGRIWLGIDVTFLAVKINKDRLEKMYPGIKFEIIGDPKDLADAHRLAQQDRYQFQWWALSLLPGSQPLGAEIGSKQGKKGSDRGIDGVLHFLDEMGGKAKRALIQIKSGKVSSRDIRDLVGTVERERAAIGIFITLEKPTSEMCREALEAGRYYSPGWQRDYPRIQILTIEELLAGTQVKMPQAIFSTLKQAKRQTRQDEGAVQGQLAI